MAFLKVSLRDILKHELQVTDTSFKFRVKSLKARVEIRKYEFKYGSSNSRVMSLKPLVANSNPCADWSLNR